MSQVTEHLKEIADVIGPRPATTDTEARAADYVERIFRAYQLEVERQDFDCPRTDSWAFAAYHVLTIAAALVSAWLPWPALVLAAAVAVLLWLDIDTRWGLSSLMPKGPSQNVIGRHVPKARRGERLRRVIVVAHYDTGRPSLTSSPGLVRRFATLTWLMVGASALVPVAILVRALPWTSAAMPWTWYATLALAAYLLFPLLVALHRELLTKGVDGANDNASGVAAMLGLVEAMVPASEAVTHELDRIPPVRRTPEAAVEADVVPEDALLSYTPVVPAPDRMASGGFDSLGDVGWDDDLPPARSAAQSALDFGDEVDVLEPVDSGAADLELPGRGRQAEHRGFRDWLGVGKGFDVRREGRKIGSWDNFSDEDDDGLDFKGGAAGELDFDDPGFAAEEAARIRRRVTTGVDRALTEKEVWFVATGAEESGAWGMRAFLSAFAEEARDAVIINLDTVGTGTLSWVTREGSLRQYHCDRRLAASARRVARDEDSPIRGREFRGRPTDATAALARGFKAMSIMAFDINGRLANWHRPSDTADLVQPENLELVVSFTSKLIRDL